MAQLLLDDRGQAPEALAEIHRLPIQVDLRHPGMGTQPVLHASIPSRSRTRPRLFASMPRIS
ncbi:hypothetical protein, partial [Thiolapillus sp.]|uniref:hypothetical protein n=1 Tax=Thiolapillus sp. TaxID=2017437 RepID=UPI003AF6F69B